jgi:hypothetical protein
MNGEQAKNQEPLGEAFGQKPLVAKVAKNCRQDREESSAQISEEFSSHAKRHTRFSLCPLRRLRELCG